MRWPYVFKINTRERRCQKKAGEYEPPEKRGLLAVTAFAVSITLYFDVAKKNRAIKTREEELKKLAEG
jgi:hypothetical protein